MALWWYSEPSAFFMSLWCHLTKIVNPCIGTRIELDGRLCDETQGSVKFVENPEIRLELGIIGKSRI